MSNTESNELALAPVNPGFHKATSALAMTLGIEPRMMIDTLKKQCFPGQLPANISDPQLAAFISVANALKLNPLVPGMLYAYPSKNGGIVPVTGPDGVFKVLDEGISEGKLDGYECTVFPENMAEKPTHATATIWRKNTEHPSKYTAIFSEWVVGSNPNWASRPRHMIWVRAIKQCARQVIHGIPYDEDEVAIGEMKDVTPQAEKPVRPPPPPRAAKGAAAVKQNAAPAPEVVIEQEPATPPVESFAQAAEATAQAEPRTIVGSDSTVRTESAEEMRVRLGNPKSPEPRTRLNEGEKFTANVEVVVLKPMRMSGRKKGTTETELVPVVYAEVKGDYTGAVVHPEGALISGDEVAADKPWAVGAKLRLDLLGGKSAKAVVEKAEPQGAPEQQQEEF